MPEPRISRRRCSSSRRSSGRSRAKSLKKSSWSRRGSSMWSRNTRAAGGRLLRWLAVAAAAALTAGCFQPLYGEHATGPGTVNANVRDAFATVDVDQIAAPNGTPEARIAVEVRNAVIWELTGGAGAGTPAYRLGIKMTLSKTAIIVDIATGRTE